MGQDIRIALRLLIRDRGFTALVVLALGLGIGVNTTFFSLVNAAVLRGLPIEAPGNVMFLSFRDDRNSPRGLTLVQYEDFRRTSQAFAALGAYIVAPVTIGDDGGPLERVPAASVSACAFQTLGVAPVLGRTFGDDDDRAGTDAVAVISHRLWQARYGARRSIRGQFVSVNGVPMTIVGVMGDRFQFPGNSDVWIPLRSVATPPLAAATATMVSVFGRLAAGRIPAQAQLELESFRMRWSREPGARLDGLRASAVPINQQFFGRVTDTVWLAFITAGALVLLIACANVANLLLMRAVARDHEIAVRMSLGASRGRIVRQLLVESSMLALLGGLAGLGLAMAGLRLLQSLVPDQVARLFDFAFDAPVVVVLVGVSAASVMLFGLSPALHLGRRAAGAALRDGGRGSGGVVRRTWATAFLAAEFALTLVLLANVTMSMRSVRAADQAQLPIDPRPILTMSMTLPNQQYETAAQRLALFRRLAETVNALPSVSAAALTSVLPEAGGLARQVAIGASGQFLAGALASRAVVVTVSERYFETVGVPLLRGRPFNGADGTPGLETAIVNERFVAVFLRGVNPIGALVQVADADGSTPGVPLQVVGVVPSVRQSSEDGVHPDPVVYLPLALSPPSTIAVVVRTGGNPTRMTAPVRAAVRELDPLLPLDRVMTMTEALRQMRWNGRVSRILLNGIGAVALLLALVGLYAVTAHSVRLRRKELGIRMTLGATRPMVGALVLRQVLRQLALGLTIGVCLTYVFDRMFITSPIRPIDLPSLLPTVASIIVVGVAACLAPALRAVSIDPAFSLRDE